METVLIVDDHAGFRLQARRLLEADGYQVIGEAADGASAIQATRSLKPDVVLLDIQLPDASGFDVARELSSLSSIVLISSRSAADYGPRVKQSGALGFISKVDLSGPEFSDTLHRSDVPSE